jgi:hypothetical protein
VARGRLGGDHQNLSKQFIAIRTKIVVKRYFESPAGLRGPPQSTDWEGDASSAPVRRALRFDFKFNGKAAHSDAPSLTPPLWVIREELKLTGTRTKFGCGTL